MKKLFYNDIAFRLLAPTMFGLVIYLMVLMFFDSIEMLADNFFSREVMFTIGLSYIFFELNRLVIVACNRIFRNSTKFRLRIIIQYLLSLLLSISAISYALYLYFVYIEGFSTIQTEIITFNSIFIVVAIFYHLFFYSLLYLNRKNEVKVEKELNKRASLDAELQAYKYQINPELLFQSLEIIISELYNDRESADGLVTELSKVYRYTLDNQDNDLVSLKNEIDSMEAIYCIFKAKFPESLHLLISIDEEESECNLIPGTLRILFEKALSENIISKKLKMEITIRSEGDELLFTYKTHPKITYTNGIDQKINRLTSAYSYFSSKGIRKINNEGYLTIALPLLKIEEEL